MRLLHIEKGKELFINYTDDKQKKNILLKGIVKTSCYVSITSYGLMGVASITEMKIDTELGEKFLSFWCVFDNREPFKILCRISDKPNDKQHFISADAYESIDNFYHGIKFYPKSYDFNEFSIDYRGYKVDYKPSYSGGTIVHFSYYFIEDGKVENGWLSCDLLCVKVDKDNMCLIPSFYKEKEGKFYYATFSHISEFKQTRYYHKEKALKDLRMSATIIGADFKSKQVEKTPMQRLKEWADQQSISMNELKSIISSMQD